MSNSAYTNRADFKVGEIVSNFGAVVRIEKLDNELGMLVQIIPAEKDGKTQGGAGQRFYANPAFCERIG